MSDAHIEVTLKGHRHRKLFNGIVQPGEEFSFKAPDGTTLGDIIVKITAQTEIQGDCDKPIGPGLVSGDFEVTGGRSKEGELLCPVHGSGGDHQQRGKHNDRHDIMNSTVLPGLGAGSLWSTWFRSLLEAPPSISV